MRKLVQILSTAILGASLIAGVASASTATCGVSDTGPGSTNTVNCVDSNNTTVTCNNKDMIEESSGQSASSGSTSSSSNTTSGNSTSGMSSNSNTDTVSVGASCTPVSTKSGGTTFTTSAIVAKTAPAAAAKSTTTMTTATPSSLPDTGSNSALVDAAIGVAIVAGVMGLARLGFATLKHQQLR
jgi:hypothetical protein